MILLVATICFDIVCLLPRRAFAIQCGGSKKVLLPAVCTEFKKRKQGVILIFVGGQRGVVLKELSQDGTLDENIYVSFWGHIGMLSSYSCTQSYVISVDSVFLNQ